MAEYAANTKVTVEKTKADIEKLLHKYGCRGFASAWHEQRERLTFLLDGMQIRFEFRRPEISDLDEAAIRRKMTTTKKGWEETSQAALEQARRVLWRQLYIGIQAKLVLVDAGIVTIEEEFFAQIVLPNNQRMHQWASPYLQNAIEQGKMPPLLPGSEAAK